jgi:hypothetical protein
MKIKIFYDGRSPAKVVDPEGREIEGVCHVVLQLQTGSEPHCVITIKNPAVKFTGEAVVNQIQNEDSRPGMNAICYECARRFNAMALWQSAPMTKRAQSCDECEKPCADLRLLKAPWAFTSAPKPEPPPEPAPFKDRTVQLNICEYCGGFIQYKEAYDRSEGTITNFNCENCGVFQPRGKVCSPKYSEIPEHARIALENEEPPEPPIEFIMPAPAEPVPAKAETYGGPQHGKAAIQAVRVPKLEESFICICAKCASKRGDFSEWRKRPAVWHGECQECKQMATVKNAPLLKFEEPAPPAKPEEITGHICKACAQKWDLNAWLKAPVAGIGKCDKCGINAGLRPVQMLVFPRSEPEPQKLADIDPKGGAARYSYFVDGLEVKVCYVHTTGRCLRDLLPDAKRGYAIFLESTDIEEKDRQILDETVIDLDQQLPKHFYTVPPASCGGEKIENWSCAGEGCFKQKITRPQEPWTLVRIEEQGATPREPLRFCLECWRKINALIAF